MNIREAIYGELSTNATITAQVSTRIYPDLLPQNPTYPALVYQKVSGPRFHAHDGPTGLTDPRFQFDCYAETFEGAKDLANALRGQLNGFSGLMGGVGGVTVDAVIFDNEIDDYGNVEESFRVTVDFIIYHQE